MKHPARFIIAMTLLATTLCVGRSFAAGPTTGAESRLPGERLAVRLTRSLTRSLGRTVGNRPLVVQRFASEPAVQATFFVSSQAPVSDFLSPIQLPQPPPLL